MKKFILKTLSFILPIVILLAMAEYTLRIIPNDYSYKKSYLDEHAGEIRTLILGHSHAYLGIDPSQISGNAFNAAHVSQSYDLDFEIFKKYRQRLKKLEYVVVTVSYESLWDKLSYGIEHWRVKNYVLYYGIKRPTDRLRDHFELLSGRPKHHLGRLYKYYFLKESVGCDALGLGISSHKTAADLYESGKATALRHTLDDINSRRSVEIFSDNVKMLDSLAKICDTYNIKLIFITTPTFAAYRENLNATQLGKTIETINDMTRRHDNVYYIDWGDAPDFTADDFHDADHLSGSGAKKLSIKLNKYIDSIGRELL